MEPPEAALKVSLESYVKLIFHSVRQKHVGMVELASKRLTCECVSGFSGPLCGSDLSFCQADSCLNGGTYLEVVGTQTGCECPPHFTVVHSLDLNLVNLPSTT